MKQRITSEHFDDDQGRPAGGRTSGVGISIDWQDGPLGRGADRQEPNGAFVEGVIQAAADRIEYRPDPGRGPRAAGDAAGPMKRRARDVLLLAELLLSAQDAAARLGLELRVDLLEPRERDDDELQGSAPAVVPPPDIAGHPADPQRP